MDLQSKLIRRNHPLGIYMGQAKDRGTKEQRVAWAIEAREAQEEAWEVEKQHREAAKTPEQRRRERKSALAMAAWMSVIDPNIIK